MARVLVVDDEPAVRTTASRILALDGHEVLVASGGREALRLLQGTTVDLVITDLAMPGMDGMEVIRNLRHGPVPPPIIVISGVGYANQHDLFEAARLLGAASTLAKPFSVEELRGAVREALPGGKQSSAD